MSSILDIFRNANKFTKYDINGNKKSRFKISSLVFNFLPILLGCTIVFVSKDSFDFDTKTIGALLSLFTGLLFGLLLKISDKVRQIPSKEEVKSENQINKRLQEVNYLKLFFYFLSYSILVSVGLITLLIVQSFVPQLHKTNLSEFVFVDVIDIYSVLAFLKVFFICIYRFSMIYLLLNFILYILLSISYLYEYIKFDFSKIE